MTQVWQPGTLYPPGSVVVPTAVTAVASDPPDNAGFESGDSDWTKGTGWAINDDDAFVGDYSAVNTGTGADLAIVNDLQAVVTPGQSVSARCLIKTDASDSDAEVAVALRWYDSGPTLISDSVGNYVSGSNGWKDSRVTATAPAGAAFLSVIAIAQNPNGTAVRVDAFTWNHVVPTDAQSLAFRAIQASSGLSGSTEPTWPTSVSGTVVDGEVTWEAFEARTVTWQASPLLVSGDTEPAWPIEGDSYVADGTIAWKAIPFRIEDENCPHSKVVAIGASKVFAGDEDVIRYCGTLNPRDWTSAQDAGFLPSGLQQKGQVGVEAMGIYRGNLAAWSASTFQMWQIDPDPTAMALLDTMEGIGTTYPKAVQPVSNDLFMLSALGVRTVGMTAGSGNLQAGDVGLPIDSLVQTFVAGKQPIASYYPSAGQYWLTTSNEDPVPPDPPLLMLCPVLDGGTAGTAYSYTPTVTNGDGVDLTFTISDGELPDGLTLDPYTGEISGTPTEAGDFEFTLTVSAPGFSPAECQHSLAVGMPSLWWIMGQSAQSTSIWSGDDLATWSSHTLSAAFNPEATGGNGANNMAFADDSLCMIGTYTGVSDGYLSTSDLIVTGDGITVSRGALPSGTGKEGQVSVAGGLIFITFQGGGNTNYAVSSDGGATWSAYAQPTNSAGVNWARTVFKIGSRWFMQLNPCASPFEDMAYSDEVIPTTWTRFSSVGISNLRNAVVCNGSYACMFINAGANPHKGSVYRSSDGMNWTRIDTPWTSTGDTLFDAGGIATETGFLFGVKQSSTESMIASDDNGATWSSCASVGTAVTPAYKIAYEDLIVVRDNSADQIGYITDDFGATWSTVTRPYTLAGGDMKMCLGHTGDPDKTFIGQ